MKNALLAIVSLLIISTAFAQGSSCLYKPGSFIFRCSNNLPGTTIRPGEEGNITIYCCFTSDYYKEHSDEEVNITYKILNEFFQKVQREDLSWNEVTYEYPASNFITEVEIPNKSKGFTDIPIVIHYKLPAHSEYYKPGAVLYSRIDFDAKIPGSFMPRNSVYPRIIIPQDWKPDNTINIVLGILGGILLLVPGGFLIRKKRKAKKLKKIINGIKK